jgi:selenocysteine lyase/cysteine desulfurase
MNSVTHPIIAVAPDRSPENTTERFFRRFRREIIGCEQQYLTPYGLQRLVYADWIASGRLYRPIERIISEKIGPYIGNTHTETSLTGKLMTQAYHEAHQQIKRHVHAGKEDVIITTGSGMTSAVVKFQRILGLKQCHRFNEARCLSETERPVVFLSHMEHHSNHTSWYETIAEVVVVKPGNGLVFDLNHLEDLLKKYKQTGRRLIGSFTACSNVTGVRTPVKQIASLMHIYNGIVFIDYAASAPYDAIDMHPADPLQQLDAVYFSPHKFLGGPGSSGVLIFNSSLYHNRVPDQPGGGTVNWTNPWGEYDFIDDIELREDGGTPGFLQAIRASLSMNLKEAMGVDNIHVRENQLLVKAFNLLEKIPGLHILANNVRNRLGVISFYIENIHYNLVVTLLSDRFGIQVRGGCACAGTYGHYLLNVNYETSKRITDQISHGDLSAKPGWVRLSLHPTMQDEEVVFIATSIEEVARNYKTWSEDYQYDKHTNEFKLKAPFYNGPDFHDWFSTGYLSV